MKYLIISTLIRSYVQKEKNGIGGGGYGNFFIPWVSLDFRHDFSVSLK